MANLNSKAIRAHEKRNRILSKLLQPKGGMKAYILKRDGRTKSFTILAVFDNFNVETDHFRNREYVEFAAQSDKTFSDSGIARNMREIAEIATHIATVENIGGDSVTRALVNGDEIKPYYMGFMWRFYVGQLSDRFDPAQNATA